MPRRSDIWRIGIARTAFADLATRGSLEGVAVKWLPEQPSFTFLADPFGLWRDGRLHLFAEAYDYRTRHGVIQHLELDRDLAPATRTTCLAEPWHLSYPQLIEADGETWMLPEASRSGGLTLYRADAFPLGWAPTARIALDAVPIDATPLFHDGLWWLLYSPSGSRERALGHLHIAFAERLTGPWRTHPLNPVRIDRASARPGGTAQVIDGAVLLPVQDCSRTYGSAIRMLRVTTLTPDLFEAEAGPRIIAPKHAAPYLDGLHTLSACGPVTLVDVKRIDRSPRGLLIDLKRKLGLGARAESAR